MANGRIWSPEEKKDAIDGYLAGETQPSIAERLGRTTCAVERFLNLRAMGVQKNKKATIPRRCLRCEDDFMSEGNHNRLCEPCNDGDNYMPAGRLQACYGPNHTGKYG